jgi:inosine/xanthosine triphosphate pyrophosphatase family protein
MTRIVFVTPHQGRLLEVQRVLSGVDVVFSRWGPALPQGLGPADSAALRARSAFAVHGEPCVTENTWLEIEGEAPLRGSQWKALAEELGESGFCQRFAGRKCDACVVVALAVADRDDAVTLFSGRVSGQIADAARGEGGYGWDRVFVPEGYLRTFAELGNGRLLLNMRYSPYLDLLAQLRGERFGGAFESHLTVRLGAQPIEAFRRACDELDVKCVLIELPEGAHSLQPMTASFHRGTLREALDEAHELGRALVGRGFEPIRTKLEALPKNADIPQTDAEAARSPKNYFEYHLKLPLPAGSDLAALGALVRRHDAHLSRNANARRADGSEDRFVTLRVHGAGQATANERFAALELELRDAGHAPKGRIREYTVYDSNLDLDAGWL